MGRTIWHCQIAASLDGKIARPDGSVHDWLAAEYPAEDFGFDAFFAGVDAILRIDVAHVPYRGSSLASEDMLAGRVHLMIDPYGTVRGAAEAGHVGLLAVTSAERVASLPEVPTPPEAGGPPGFKVTGFVGLVAPGATPRPLLSRLEQAVAWAMRETDLPRAYDAQGLVPRFADGAAFRALMARERGRWERLAQETSIALD